MSRPYLRPARASSRRRRRFRLKPHVDVHVGEWANHATAGATFHQAKLDQSADVFMLGLDITAHPARQFANGDFALAL